MAAPSVPPVDSIDPAAPAAWRPTRALQRATAVVGVALVLAIVLTRVELVLVAVPFALGTAVSLTARPQQAPQPALSLDSATTVEGTPVAARVAVRNDDPLPLLCVVSVAMPVWVRLHHGTGQYATLVEPSDTTVVRLAGTALRWGAHWVGPATVRATACDGLLRAQRHGLPPAPLSVYPHADVFDSDAPLPRATGISGIHRSRRPGHGGELADVRQFQLGDRLRRINWRVTQRTGDLHVNATYADRDADVVLVLDLRHEAGASGGIAGETSVLDATVRAAAAITEHYTHQGDRVALVEFGPQLRRLPAGTGRRHYFAALGWLAGVDLRPAGFAPGEQLFARTLRPPGAMLVVLTPVLDGASAALLATLVRSGRSMVAVDTLPPEVRPPGGETEWSGPAERLWRLERANTLGRLRDIGVPVEQWRGAGSLDVVLRHAHRQAARAGVVRR